MRIPDDDPERNKTILKVLAGYSGVGVRQRISGYDYDDTPFKQIVDGFI